MKIIFLFIDGFGMGDNDPDRNPLVFYEFVGINRILKGHTLFCTDACLDVPGLPQSATGQTSIFTGVNAQALLGRHLNGQPTKTLKELIYKQGLFGKLARIGKSVTNANVYRDEYLLKMLNPKCRRYRPSVTSVMTMAAGLPFRTAADYRKGSGVYHDITGRIFMESGYSDCLITPEEAARRLVRISREYDFTLFEHFMTDIIGHRMDMTQAVDTLKVLDAFFGELYTLIDMNNETVILASDHGNIEDISVKTHTVNRVPVVIAGRGEAFCIHEIKNILDIYPVVLDLIKK